MRFGVQYLFRRAPGDSRSTASLYQAELEQIRLAESLDFDDVWVGERHFAADERLPSPLAAAAAVAARTTRVGIGTNALVAALHHPLRLAEDCAIVDNLSGGRFSLGLALGSGAADFATLGVPFRERAGRLEETVEIVRRCWTEDSFRHEGSYFSFDHVRCRPQPTQATIPIWIAAERAERALRRAASIGDGWLAPEAPHGAARASYLRALADAQRPTERPRIAATPRMVMFASDDPERDERWLRPLARELAVPPAGAAGAKSPPKPPGGLDSADQLLDRLLLVGTPEEIVAEITTAYERGSFTHHIHTSLVSGAPAGRSEVGLELFAREVLPRVRALGESGRPGQVR